MKATSPIVRARITLLPELKSFKSIASGTYRPHIVLGPLEQRKAILDGQLLTEEYLGVSFIGGPDKIYPGETVEVELALAYYPRVTYAGIQVGATFTIREGGTVVGYGTVLTSFEPP